MNTPNQHILFRRIKKGQFSGRLTLFFAPPESKEAWQENDNDTEEKKAEKPEEALEYVAHVKSGKEVADHVRKSPLDKYVLFRGEVTEIEVAIPVYIGGKSADGVGHEWDVSNDPR